MIFQISMHEKMALRQMKVTKQKASQHHSNAARLWQVMLRQCLIFTTLLARLIQQMYDKLMFFFLIFSLKIQVGFDIPWRQFYLNIKAYFLRKIRKCLKMSSAKNITQNSHMFKGSCHIVYLVGVKPSLFCNLSSEAL